jgi:hypothetical protein
VRQQPQRLAQQLQRVLVQRLAAETQHEQQGQAFYQDRANELQVYSSAWPAA